MGNYHRYDDFKADDPKVFLGEYASWGNTYYYVGTIFEMSGYGLDEINSFKSPERIVPKEKMITINSSDFNYCFTKQSITIFRFHKK